MRTLVRWMLVAAVVAAIGGTASAQRQPGGGGQRGGGGGGQPGGGFGGFGFGMGGGGGLKGMLATNKALQEELKLSADQIDKIKAFNEKQASATPGGGGGGGRGAGGAGGAGGGGGGRGGAGGGGRGAGGGGGAGGFGGFGGGGFGAFGGGGGQTDEERLDSLKTQVKNLEERIAFFKDTLNADQTKRIGQIETQQSMQTSGPAIFSTAKVSKALNLTTDQKDKLKGLTDEYTKETGDLRREYFGGGGGGGGGFDAEKMQEMQKKQKGIRDEATDKVEKMLTADQKKAWKDLVGEPFDMAKLAPQRRDN